MRTLDEYKKELGTLVEQINELEKHKQELTTRAIEVQGVVKELTADKEVKK